VVPGHELGDPDQVSGVDGLKREVARCQVAKEPDLGLPAKSRGEQVDNIGDDESRYEERTGVGLQRLPARRMMGIVAVDVRVERARVDDQRDWSVSATMISSIRSVMSVRPLWSVAAASRRRRVQAPARTSADVGLDRVACEL
jgi:hypothetical protein